MFFCAPLSQCYAHVFKLSQPDSQGWLSPMPAQHVNQPALVAKESTAALVQSFLYLPTPCPGGLPSSSRPPAGRHTAVRTRAMAACRAPPMIMGCNCATQAGVELFSKTDKKERPREERRAKREEKQRRGEHCTAYTRRAGWTGWGGSAVMSGRAPSEMRHAGRGRWPRRGGAGGRAQPLLL